MSRAALVFAVLLTGCDRVSWLGDTVQPGRAGEAMPAVDGVTPPTGPATTSTTRDDCAEGTPFTWENTAQPIVHTWCTPCHGAAVTGADRSGAPADVALDTRDDLVLWADEVAQTIQTTSPTMPPAGGLTDDERAALVEWLACGAPLEESEVTLPGPCDTLVYATTADPCVEGANAVEGDLLVAGDDDLQCICVVEGRLLFEGGVDVVAPHLSRVGGDLQVEGSALVQLDLSSLKDVGGQVLITDNEHLVSLDIDRVATVGGDVVVARNPALTDLYLSWVRHLPGEILIEDNAAMVRAELSRVESIEGSFRIVGNGAVTDLDNTRTVLSVGGDIEIRDNEGLEVFNGFSRLVELGGDIHFENNRDLREIYGFHSIERLSGSILVTDHRRLEVLHAGVLLEEVGGSLEVWNAPRLATWEGTTWLLSIGAEADSPEAGRLVVAGTALERLPDFAALESVGSIRVEDNPELPQLGKFEELRVVTGDLLIKGNTSLSTVDGFARVEEIGRLLEIRDNRLLDRLVSFGRLETLGGLRLADNPLLPRPPPIEDVRAVAVLDIAGNAAMTTLEGLEGIGDVTSYLVISDNPSLPELAPLSALERVDGSVVLTENDALIDLEGLHSLRQVGGNLTIVRNSALRETSVVGLVDAVGAENIEGRIEVRDNGW